MLTPTKKRKRGPSSKTFMKNLTDIIRTTHKPKEKESIDAKLKNIFVDYIIKRSSYGTKCESNPLTNTLIVEVKYLDFFVDSYLHLDSPHRVSLDKFEFEASIFKSLSSGKKIIQVDFYEKVTKKGGSFSPIYKLNTVFSEYENK